MLFRRAVRYDPTPLPAPVLDGAPVGRRASVGVPRRRCQAYCYDLPPFMTDAPFPSSLHVAVTRMGYPDWLGVPEPLRERLRRPVTNAADAAELYRALAPLLSLPLQEQAVAFYLNGRGLVIGWLLIGLGNIRNVAIDIPAILRPAVIVGAASVLFAHNHPSGDPTPSVEDVAVTRTVHDAGKLLGIKLLDAIVVAGRDWSSLAELGYLPYG